LRVRLSKKVFTCEVNADVEDTVVALSFLYHRHHREPLRRDELRGLFAYLDLMLLTDLPEILNAGCPEADAREVVQRARDILCKAANRLLGYSTALMLVGILVTAGSYSAATSSGDGGIYVICYGAIVCGALGAIVGLYRRLALRQ